MVDKSIFFDVSPTSGVPIYRQLVEQVHALMAGGQLQSGDRLPSVRKVALALAINPMTVSRAYSLLEGEGLVRRLRGQGMEIVDSTNSLSRDERLNLFRKTTQELIRPALQRAKQLGLTSEEIESIINAEIESLFEELQP